MTYHVRCLHYVYFIFLLTIYSYFCNRLSQGICDITVCRKDTVWRTLFTFLIPNSHGFLCDKGLSWTVRKLLSESLQALIRVAWKKRVLGTSYDAAMDISRILFSQRASRHSCHAQRGLPIGSESLWLEPTEAWNTCQHHTGGYQTN